ncbi:MAG: TonB-dependent receptor, partial [Sulfurovum sp.]
YNLQGGLFITNKDEVDFSYKKIDAVYEYDTSAGSDGDTQKSYLNHYFKSGNYIHKEDSFNFKANIQQSKFDRTQGTFNAKSLVNEFSLTSNYIYAKDSNITTGLNKQNFEDINSNNKYNTKAIFLSNSNKFNNLIFSQTIRYDNNSSFDEKATGKLGLKYEFDKDFSASTNYGTAYNAPTLSNLSITPTLEPESTRSYDINLEYKGFEITYFKTKIKNLIDYYDPDSWTGPIPGSYINTKGTSIIKGYEASYKKDILKDLFLGLNYTHLNAKNSNNEDLARRAKNLVNLSLDYYGIKKTHINLNGQYVGTRYNGEDKTGAQTGRYTLWNSVVNYDINKNLKTYLKVDNLFNKYYQTVDGYATSPRAFYAGLKATF